MRPIVTFLLTTAALTAAADLLLLGLARNGHYMAFRMWCPGLGALLTCMIHRMPFSTLGFRWGATRYQVLALALPAGYIAASYAVAGAFGLAGYNAAGVKDLGTRLGLSGTVPNLQLVAGVLTYGLIGIAPGLTSALGEEIGWRGLLQPRLAAARPAWQAGLVVGVLWSLWHVPLMIFPNPLAQLQQARTWADLGCFFAVLIGLSWMMGWLRNQSGGVWAAMFLHAAHNNMFGFAPRVISGSKDIDRYVGENGWITGAVCLAMGAVFAFGRPALRGTARE